MKKSPVHPKCDHHIGDEYSFQADFSLFLEEAKRSERVKTESLTSHAKPAEQEMNKKKKKPWKAFLLPWWKAGKSDEPLTNSPAPKNTRQRFASGTLFGGRARGSASGPLMTSLFNPVRKSESEVPYACLGQLGNPSSAKNYGPVYLVT